MTDEKVAPNVLVTTTIGGNLYMAVNSLNKLGLADYVIALDYSASYTIAVLRMPESVARALKEAKKL